MVKLRKSYYKSILVLFRKQWIRFALLIGVNLIGVGVMAGLGPIADLLKQSYSENLRRYDCPDLILLNQTGQMSGSDPETLSEVEGAEANQSYFTVPVFDDFEDKYYQYYSHDFANDTIGIPTLLEGRYPETSDEMVVETTGNALDVYNVGDQVNVYVSMTSQGTVQIPDTSFVFEYSATIVFTKTYTVTGIVHNPMYGDKNNYPSLIDPERNMSGIYYFDSSFTTFENLEVTLHTSIPGIEDLDFTLPVLNLRDNAFFVRTRQFDSYQIYSGEYLNGISRLKNDCLNALGEDYVALTYEENAGAVSLNAYADKVMALTYILSAFFIAVVVLVIASTLSRLVEEERAIIACYRSLGVSTADIFGKYALFAILSIAIGAVLGLLILGGTIQYVLYSAFSTSFFMGPMTSMSYPTYGAIATIITAGAALLSTILVLLNSLKESPASLLQPKAPKAGRTILLERIKPIWKHLAFKTKSMFRNLFRHPIRTSLTLVAVIGSTTLLFAGFGILDASLFGELPNAEVISYVAIVIIVIAALLSLLVLTNITNISVSEKNREIATLMVLGYSDREVAMYVYREIDFVAFFAVLIGIPVGVLFTMFVFGFVDFGKLEDIQWYSYLLVPLMELLMMLLSNILLLRKIKKTDMNGSLKAVE